MTYHLSKICQTEKFVQQFCLKGRYCVGGTLGGQMLLILYIFKLIIQIYIVFKQIIELFLKLNFHLISNTAVSECLLQYAH
jgi:hypothetical protein